MERHDKRELGWSCFSLHQNSPARTMPLKRTSVDDYFQKQSYTEMKWNESFKPSPFSSALTIKLKESLDAKHKRTIGWNVLYYKTQYGQTKFGILQYYHAPKQLKCKQKPLGNGKGWDGVTVCKDFLKFKIKHKSSKIHCGIDSNIYFNDIWSGISFFIIIKKVSASRDEANSSIYSVWLNSPSSKVTGQH